MTLDFLELIDDAELCEEIRDVLRQMEIVSEAPATKLSGITSASSEKPPGPPGFIDAPTGKAPPKGRSLHEHFVFRFRDLVERGEPRKRLWFLLWEAEHDLKRRVIPPTEAELLERIALEAHRPTQSSKEEEEFAAQIVASTEGVHARKVGLDYNLPQGWIEKVRELAGCEPVMGRPRPAWRQLGVDRKRELVAEQQQMGRTQVEAAKALGCGERTVKQYWPRPVAA